MSRSRVPPRSSNSSRGRGRRRQASRARDRVHAESRGGTACRTGASASSSGVMGAPATGGRWAKATAAGSVCSSGTADLRRAPGGRSRRELVVRDGEEPPREAAGRRRREVCRADTSTPSLGEVSHPYSYEDRALVTWSAAPPEDVVVAVSLRGSSLRDLAAARARRRRAAEPPARRRPPSAHDRNEPLPRDHRHVHRLEGPVESRRMA